MKKYLLIILLLIANVSFAGSILEKFQQLDISTTTIKNEISIIYSTITITYNYINNILKGFVFVSANSSVTITTPFNKISNIQITQKESNLLDINISEVFNSSFTINNSNLSTGATIYYLVFGE